MFFAATEYHRRVERMQALMTRDGIDALLLTHRNNFEYFSGFHANQMWATPTRSMTMVIPRSGDPAIIIPAYVAEHAGPETSVSDIRGFTRIDRIDVELISATLADKGLGSGRLGLELGQEQRINFTPKNFELLRETLSANEVVDAAPLIWELRLRKSEAEIAEVRRACRATDAGLAALWTAPRKGMSERKLVELAHTTGLQNGADWPGFVCATSGPGYYNRMLGDPRDRELEQGDMFWIDLGLVSAGYYTDYCRSGVVGGPTDHQIRTQRSIREATLAGIAAIRPGAPVADVARAALGKAEEVGLPVIRFGRVGHGIGLGMTEPPYVAEYDPTILAPGMLITVEPTVYDDTGIYCIEEIIVVTEDGNEVLSGAPRDVATI